MNFWWRDRPPAWSLALAPLSAAYRAGAFLHRSLARPVKPGPAPIISVGNLTVGGAGKTPAVMVIEARLRARGRRPAVLSRGYGRRTRQPMQVLPQTPVQQCGDEPLLLARRGLTVFVGPSRAQLVPLALERGADVLLLDDGLQHHQLARDLDVIVADASNPFGNGSFLPRGPLREGTQALRRASNALLWLTRCDLPRHPRTAELCAFGLPAVESAYESGAELRGRRVFLFAGIARPASFEASVRKLGAEIGGVHWFSDHHFFSARELAGLRREAQGALLVTTEKDLVRIERPDGIVALSATLRILRGEEALDRALESVL